jgi:hypothetical protein
MTYGAVEEVFTAKKHFTERDFGAVLENPSAGIFDAPSCTYWNLVYGRSPAPTMAKRTFPE